MSTYEPIDDEVEWYKKHACRFGPLRRSKLRATTRRDGQGCLKTEHDPDFIAMCEEHDKMMLDELKLEQEATDEYT